MDELKGVVIGFTGRRDGMSEDQRASVESALQFELRNGGPVSVLHGDAIGADADFNEIAKGLNLPRFCRPCTFEDQRAFTDAKAVSEPINPMARNRAIVADANVLIGCPPTDHELERSGTWATIRYMRKAKKTLVIVNPDGSLLYERFG